ncbi:C-C motif chemokine 7-like [Narcine bancroftii]|uniref:C-C motif chemokine 7-like n=1 Tax=Narcine bancroftii TaxID=1343680 RepID=UPI003831FAC1
MKTALCVLTLLGALLICGFPLTAAAPAGTIRLECCESFKTSPIPRWRLKGYKESPLCSIPAVIFTNRRNMRICTKAGDKWVKAAVKYLDRKHKRGWTE